MSKRVKVVEFVNGDGDDAYGVYDTQKDEPVGDSTFSEDTAQDECDRLNAGVGTVLRCDITEE